MQMSSSIQTSQNHVKPEHLTEEFHADTNTEFQWGGIDIEAVLGELADEIYGILVVPEDVPSVLANLPIDVDSDDHPLFLTHTSVFNAKFDIRDPDNGMTITQLNFSSIDHDAKILDLRRVKLGLFDRA